MPLPVAVVVPAREAATTLEAAVGSAIAEDPAEVIVAVAPSRDETAPVAARIAAADRRVRVVANPPGTTPAGLNAALAHSTATYVARLDAHAVLPHGYLRQALATIERTGAAVVGGVQVPRGTTPLTRAIAAALTHPLGAGGAGWRTGRTAGPTDTVYLGVFRRAVLQQHGGYDEALLRNQDYELNWRIRRAGGTVWLDPTLRVAYQPRGSLVALARQFLGYGRYKQAVLRRHPTSLRPRQAAAPLLVASIVAAAAAAVRQRRWAAVPAAYALGVMAATAVIGRDLDPAARRRLPAVLVTLHLSWGVGFWLGPPRRRSLG